jgi:hypothetical protein
MNLRRHVYAHRSKENELPLFPGYSPVDDNEIFSLHAAIKAQLSPEFGPFPQKGQWVRITKGALNGVEGIILEVKNSFRLVLPITLLQRSIQCEVARSCVMACDPNLRLAVSPPGPTLNTSVTESYVHIIQKSFPTRIAKEGRTPQASLGIIGPLSRGGEPRATQTLRRQYVVLIGSTCPTDIQPTGNLAGGNFNFTGHASSSSRRRTFH